MVRAGVPPTGVVAMLDYRYRRLGMLDKKHIEKPVGNMAMVHNLYCYVENTAQVQGGCVALLSEEELWSMRADW